MTCRVTPAPMFTRDLFPPSTAMSRLRALIGRYYLLVIAVLIGVSLLLMNRGPGIPYLVLAAALLLAIVMRERDIAQRIETQIDIALAELNEKNRMLLMTEATAHVGHWRLDFADDTIFWSDETYAIHGWTGDAPPPLAEAIDLFHEDDREGVANAVQTARETGQPYVFQARLIRPDGTMRHTEAVAQVETGPDGTPTGLFGVFADRTDEVAMRHDLVAARDKARAAVGAKANFLAKMSHEIRTPMNGVIGFADLLLTTDLTDEQRHHAELIADSGKALTLLLNDILDLSKIEAGELAINGKAIDLHHLLNQNIRLVEPQAREKNVHLELSIADDVPRHIIADPLRVRQVLGNLLNNAVKFTDVGFVAMDVTVRADTLEFAVRDSGIGIAIKRQAHIFDAFTQSEADTAAQRGGTGLGLTICRQLAAKMDGDLTVTSKRGKGSVFTFTMPLKHAQAQPTPPITKPDRNERSATPGHRVLLAEDYDINQMLVAAMGQQCGLQLDIADNGEEAVHMVEDAARNDRPYALVLMDLQMPVMGGLGATRIIRERGFRADDLPIVALTANAFPDDITACLEAGMQSHLAKPLTLQSFELELRRWLPKTAIAA